MSIYLKLILIRFKELARLPFLNLTHRFQIGCKCKSNFYTYNFFYNYFKTFFWLVLLKLICCLQVWPLIFKAGANVNFIFILATFLKIISKLFFDWSYLSSFAICNHWLLIFKADANVYSFLFLARKKQHILKLILTTLEYQYFRE